MNKKRYFVLTVLFAMIVFVVSANESVCDFRIGINSNSCSFVCTISNKSAEVLSLVPFASGYYNSAICAKSEKRGTIDFAEQIRIRRRTDIPAMTVNSCMCTNIFISLEDTINGFEQLIPYGEYMLWKPNIMMPSSKWNLSYSNGALPMAVCTNLNCDIEVLKNRRYVGLVTTLRKNFIECVGLENDFQGSNSNLLFSVIDIETRRTVCLSMPYNSLSFSKKNGSSRIRFGVKEFLSELEHNDFSIANGTRAVDVCWKWNNLISEPLSIWLKD